MSDICQKENRRSKQAVVDMELVFTIQWLEVRVYYAGGFFTSFDTGTLSTGIERFNLWGLTLFMVKLHIE